MTAKQVPAGFVNLRPREYAAAGSRLYCARCGTATTVNEVRLNKINGGQYSLCCDDNLVAIRPRSSNYFEPKR